MVYMQKHPIIDFLMQSLTLASTGDTEVPLWKLPKVNIFFYSLIVIIYKVHTSMISTPSTIT